MTVFLHINSPSIQQSYCREIALEQVRLMVLDFPVLNWLIIQLRKQETMREYGDITCTAQGPMTRRIRMFVEASDDVHT